jgi:hypothetical protein
VDERPLQLIDLMVRTGFYDRDQLIEIFCRERYAPGDLDEAEVTAAVDASVAALRVEQASWAHPTDCDRLDAAFAAMRAAGVVALQNAGFTQSDGYDDVRDVVRLTTDPARLVGYCFYHGQDLERAVEGRDLYLAFGPLDPKLEQSAGLAVGHTIVAALEAQGLSVAWDGTFEQRIAVQDLVWRRPVGW